MSQAVKQNLIGMIVVAVLAAVLGFAVVHAARSEPLTIVPGKFYVTATITGSDGQVYTKLAYNKAGQFESREDCLKWVPDDEFKAALPELFQMAAETFGPTANVSFDCEAAPEPANKI